MDIVIERTGDVRAVYGEELDLGILGDVNIERASHVEPIEQGRWTADMTPVNGPTLGPFSTRRKALAAEVQWLRDNWL